MQKITSNAGGLKYATKYFASERHEFSTRGGGGVEWSYVLICIVFFSAWKLLRIIISPVMGCALIMYFNIKTEIRIVIYVSFVALHVRVNIFLVRLLHWSTILILYRGLWTVRFTPKSRNSVRRAIHIAKIWSFCKNPEASIIWDLRNRGLVMHSNSQLYGRESWFLQVLKISASRTTFANVPFSYLVDPRTFPLPRVYLASLTYPVHN